jgi:hypothetical protein
LALFTKLLVPLKGKKNSGEVRRTPLAYSVERRSFIQLEREEMEVEMLKNIIYINGKTLPNVGHLSQPPPFSLDPTFMHGEMYISYSKYP